MKGIPQLLRAAATGAALALAWPADGISPVVTASSSAPGWPAAGATDGDRFAAAPGRAWRAGTSNSWWQITWDAPRPVGAILQVTGDHEFVLRNAPRDYVWQFSTDGESFADLPGTAV
ncbi:MAG: discoidin domain-containing protein, partial [Limisphaerales bacterium]